MTINATPITRLYNYINGKVALGPSVTAEYDQIIETLNTLIGDAVSLDVGKVGNDEFQTLYSSLQAYVVTIDEALEAHKISNDHDDKYYTKSTLTAMGGATLVGNTPIVHNAPSNVQESLQWLHEQIIQSTLGQIPDGSLGEIKMANDMKKNIPGGVAGYDEMQEALDELFTSVSNAKTLIAGDLTDMRVPASEDETFGELASKIRKVRAVSSTQKCTTYELMTRYGFDPIRALFN